MENQISEEKRIYDYWMHKLSPYKVLILLVLLRYSTKLTPMTHGDIEKRTSFTRGTLKTNLEKLCQMGLVLKVHDELHLYTTGNLHCAY